MSLSCFRSSRVANQREGTVHVTCGESERSLRFSEGEVVGQLRQRFLEAFPEYLSDGIRETNVRFQQYDDNTKEYVGIKNEEKLENNARVRAVIFKDDVTPKMLPKGTYRLWNLGSNGLIHSYDNSTVVSCNGNFGDPNTVIKLEHYGEYFFHLTMDLDRSGNQEKMYLTPAQGENGPIILKPTKSDDALYVPYSHYGFIMFKSKNFGSQYLGCDNNKSGATLLKMKNMKYPNPQALFTVQSLEDN